MKTPDGVKCDQCGMIFTSETTLQIHKEKFCIGLPDSGNNREDLTLGDSISIDLPENILNQTPKPNKNEQGTFYIGSPQPKAQSPIPDLQPKPLARKHTASIRYDGSNININNDNNNNNDDDFINYDSKAYEPVLTKTPINKNTKVKDDKQIKAIEDLQNFKAKKSIEQTVKDMEDLTVRDTLRDKKLIYSLNSTPNDGNSFINDQELFSTTIVNNVRNEPYKTLLKEVCIKYFISLKMIFFL